MNPKVDDFIANAENWQEEIKTLRAIVLDCGLTEELKWKQPCYTYKNTNILIISGFKEYCVLSFIKGVLLKDSENILVSPGENSQSVRFARFTSKKEITEQKAILKAYIYEAIEVENAGLKVPKKDHTELELVDELKHKINTDAKFKVAFEGLTPGRQRAYNMFFEQARQSKTRKARIEKYTPRILKGKGMNDCVCGLSKRMPNCDGSHKQLEKNNTQ